MPRTFTIAAWAAPALLAAILPLAGCSDPPPRPIVIGVGNCPSIREYTPTEERAITKAMQALPPDNPLLNAMLDYEDLRDQARICRHAAR